MRIRRAPRCCACRPPAPSASTCADKLMFGWLRRLNALPRIPEAAWQATLARYPFLHERPAEDLQRLRLLAAQFLRDKEFHGAHGFVISDEVALCIAAQAVLPLLHLKGGMSWYDDF